MAHSGANYVIDYFFKIKKQIADQDIYYKSSSFFLNSCVLIYIIIYRLINVR